MRERLAQFATALQQAADADGERVLIEDIAVHQITDQAPWSVRVLVTWPFARNRIWT